MMKSEMEMEMDEGDERGDGGERGEFFAKKVKPRKEGEPVVMTVCPEVYWAGGRE